MNFIRSVFFLLLALTGSSLEANVDDHFDTIKKDSNLLYIFFKNMPKGGELHYHLDGGPSAETMLKLAARNHYCFDKDSFMVSKFSKTCEGIQSQELFKHPLFYLDLIKNWSFKEFTPKNETAHDHFFKAFDKFYPIVKDFSPDLLASVIQKAAKQKELYLEIITMPDQGHASQFGSEISNQKSLPNKRRVLLANQAFQKNIAYAVTESDNLIKQAYDKLDCALHSKTAVCKTQVRLIFFILREQPLDTVFAQALTAFESVKQSKGNLLGVNIVQAEDGPIALRDYRQHMAIFHYLHQLYPQVKMSLHAGELVPGLVDPKELTFHIHDAVFTAHAHRIGHGVDIKHETDATSTLNYMAKHQIAVEINLTSNFKILNLAGSNHPLTYYLAHHVPVVLSTDDEGILRTDLTQQYVTAVRVNGLSYQELKLINRNALTYAFLPGKSIWSNPQNAELISNCRDLNSLSCKAFIKDNKKAFLQWTLEQKLIAFEHKY
ncbi:MAG: adenosine deaminase [Legionella sp.]|nr:adenosine deaminase [Legionella sp.]